MAENLLTSRFSRGLNSAIKGKKLNDFFKKALKEDIEPFILEHYESFVEGWEDKPTFKVIPRVGETGQTITVRVEGSNIAVDRWNMIDSEGRKGGKKIVSKKTRFKKVRETIQLRGRGRAGAVTTKVETKKVRVPMPIRQYSSKTAKYGKRNFGDGSYEDPTTYRYEVIQGKVIPLRITKNFLKKELEPEIKRSLELAYQAGYDELVRRGR
jgi:hypothetical protein